MRAEMLELMRLIEHTIILDERWADELADEARRQQATGNTVIVDILLTLGRSHRVAALSLQGRLAALHQDYARYFHDEPEAEAE